MVVAVGGGGDDVVFNTLPFRPGIARRSIRSSSVVTNRQNIFMSVAHALSFSA
jgi:hypothetical protein